MTAFIDEHRDRSTVEVIRATLNKEREGGFLSSRGYRDAKTRAPSARQGRDRELVKLVREIHAENYGVHGVRKMWHALRRLGVITGREQTRRIMAPAGVAGKRKGKNPVTTRKGKGVDTRPDLVQRDLTAKGPNQLWVADITYGRHETKPYFSWISCAVSDVIGEFRLRSPGRNRCSDQVEEAFR